MKIKILSLVLLLFTAGCNKDLPADNNDENNNPVSGYKLELIKEHPMDVKEPSGLSWDLKHENLLTVSDNTNKAYSVDTQGKTLHTFIYEGDDTEAVESVYNLTGKTNKNEFNKFSMDYQKLNDKNIIDNRELLEMRFKFF
jgi:uncharacterized protein YjiK